MPLKTPYKLTTRKQHPTMEAKRTPLEEIGVIGLRGRGGKEKKQDRMTNLLQKNRKMKSHRRRKKNEND